MQLLLPTPVCCRRIPGRVAPTLISDGNKLSSENAETHSLALALN
jgi:hypothetical protein